MKRTLAGILIGLFTFSITAFLIPGTLKTRNSRSVQSNTITSSSNLNDYERWTQYLESKRIEPKIIINADHDSKSFSLHKNRVRWISKDHHVDHPGNYDREPFVEINGDRFRLIDYKTDNIAWIERSVFAVDHIDQIRLYNYGERGEQRFIALKFSAMGCNGRYCQSDYFLVYNLKTREKKFFESYCSASDLELFDFEGNGNLVVLAPTFKGMHCTQEHELVWRPFFLGEKNAPGNTEIDFVSIKYDQGKPTRVSWNWFESVPSYLR